MSPNRCILIINNTGPSIEPCGTLHVTLQKLEIKPLEPEIRFTMGLWECGRKSEYPEKTHMNTRTKQLIAYYVFLFGVWGLQVVQDWKFVAQVLDRMFLWAFLLVSVLGSALLFIPVIYKWASIIVPKHFGGALWGFADMEVRSRLRYVGSVKYRVLLQYNTNKVKIQKRW